VLLELEPISVCCLPVLSNCPCACIFIIFALFFDVLLPRLVAKACWSLMDDQALRQARSPGLITRDHPLAP